MEKLKEIAQNIMDVSARADAFEAEDDGDNQFDMLKLAVSEARSLADIILNGMSTEMLIKELAQRATEAGVVDSGSQFCLLALKSMSASEKDSTGKNIEDIGETFINLEDFVESEESTGNDEMDEQFKRAYEFGISYVNGY